MDQQVRLINELIDWLVINWYCSASSEYMARMDTVVKTQQSGN